MSSAKTPNLTTPRPTPTNRTTRAAQPSRNIFDPWNSSSTGHQRAENRLSGSTGWRDSRTYKLGLQFRDASGAGGRRTADKVGAGSEGFGTDGRTENGGFVRGASGLRGEGQLSLWEVGNGAAGETSESPAKKRRVETYQTACQLAPAASKKEADEDEEGVDRIPPSAQPQKQLKDELDSLEGTKRPQIFRNLNFYINGSTYPTISDHKLKQLLVEHGATLSIALGRRTASHIILGDPNNSSNRSGAGGGLAASKIEKEITNVRGKNIKLVNASWVIESIKAGKRLPEARYSVLSTARRDQRSVLGMLEKSTKQSELR